MTQHIAYFFLGFLDLTTLNFFAFPFSAVIGDVDAHSKGSIVPSNSILWRPLVIGLGEETGVMALVGVDGSNSINLFDMLLVTGLAVEALVMALGGVEALDGTTVTFFLPLFLFGFGGAGGGASES